jgi:excisionase family DNA binding protein
METVPKLHSLEDAAKMIGVSMPKLYRIMGEGSLEWCQIGGSRRITEQQILDYIKRSTRSAEKDNGDAK